MLPACQGPDMQEGHGPTTGPGWPEGPQSLQFRFSYNIPQSIGNVIQATFTEQKSTRKMPADMSMPYLTTAGRFHMTPSILRDSPS